MHEKKKKQHTHISAALTYVGLGELVRDDVERRALEVVHPDEPLQPAAELDGGIQPGGVASVLGLEHRLQPRQPGSL